MACKMTPREAHHWDEEVQSGIQNTAKLAKPAAAQSSDQRAHLTVQGNA